MGLCAIFKRKYKYKRTMQEGLDHAEYLLELLQCQKQHLEDICNHIRDFGMWKKDASHRYLYANEKFRDVLAYGHNLSQVIGKTDNEIHHEEGTLVTSPHPPVFETPFDPSDLPSAEFDSLGAGVVCNITDYVCQAAEQPCRFFEQIPMKDTTLLLDVWKTPLYTRQGKFRGTVGAFQDVTNQRAYQIERLKQLEYQGYAFRIDNTGHFFMYNYEMIDKE